LELFAGQGWADYLTEMNKDSTYEDHITLRAASDIFSVQITVHSSLGVEATTIISPFTGVGVANFNLGHFAEGQREQYVCLEVEENAAESCANEMQENQKYGMKKKTKRRKRKKIMTNEKTKGMVEPPERTRQQRRAVATAYTRIRMRMIISKVGAKRNVHLTTFQTK